MSRTRVRVTLLLLLWIWAGCVLLVLDLFFEVPAFDRVRPRSGMYAAMRAEARRMVGAEAFEAAPPIRPVLRPDRQARMHALLEELESVRAMERRNAIGELREAAARGAFAQTRMAALEALAAGLGAEARPFLAERVRDGSESDSVRGAAARQIGRTGGGAVDALAELARADLPAGVRAALLDATARAMVAPTPR